MATAIIPLITAGITEVPAVVNIIKSIIGLFNHTKKAALTPEQATSTATAATQAATAALAVAQSNGVISTIPNETQLTALIQAMYWLDGAGLMPGAAPANVAVSAPQVLSPQQQALIAALVAAILNPAKV